MSVFGLRSAGAGDGVGGGGDGGGDDGSGCCSSSKIALPLLGWSPCWAALVLVSPTTMSGLGPASSWRTCAEAAPDSSSACQLIGPLLPHRADNVNQ